MNKLLFDRVTKWQDETFGKATPISKLHHLEDEIEELMEGFAEMKNSDEIKSEYADCFLLLYGSAAKFGMSYDDINLAISRKMDINEKRKWGKPDEQGVVRHIEEGNEFP